MDWENKTVLITGADGFIGSHLTEYLLKTGAKVRALAIYNSQGSYGWLDHLEHSNLEIVLGDVRDPFFCDSLVCGIDIVFHLAALIAIPYSYSAPNSYIETNVNGTLNICQAALKHKCERVLITSTSEVYGTAQYVPINETHPLQPQSPYSASKIAADSIAMSFYYSFDLPLSIVRPFNTYGPRQSARAIIPTIISQIAAGSKIIEVGDLSPTRDFNFVEDTCLGFIAIAEKKELIGETINIASQTEVTMQETLDTIKEIMNSDVEFRVDPKRLRPSKSEVRQLLGDNSKITKHTNWKTTVDLKKGLEETIKWFTDSENLRLYKANLYNT